MDGHAYRGARRGPIAPYRALGGSVEFCVLQQKTKCDVKKHKNALFETFVSFLRGSCAEV